MKNAFVLHIKVRTGVGGQEALETGELIIGWNEAPELLDPNLSKEVFRVIIHKKFYPNDENQRRAGKATGDLWRFLREMNYGDYVVVPSGNEFFVAEVAGDPRHDSEKVDDDTAFRRPVK